MKGEGDYEFSFWGMTLALIWEAFKAIVCAEWMIFFLPYEQPFATEMYDVSGGLKTVWARWTKDGMQYGDHND